MKGTENGGPPNRHRAVQCTRPAWATRQIVTFRRAGTYSLQRIILTTTARQAAVQQPGEIRWPSSFRRDWITKPIFRLAQHALPRLSDTEREAIEAGDVWWDAELFTGNPDWNKLLAFAPARLSEEERQFLDGPVEGCARMLDDWKINWQWHDLPPEVWDFLKANKFFAMIIPKAYGGLGFSAYRAFGSDPQAVVALDLRRLTAMVPNSLGPGELLMQFGTKEQRTIGCRAWRAARKFPASASPARKPDRTPPR